MNKICCFTGHNTIPKEYEETLLKKLDENVRNLIVKNTVTEFNVGGAIGFDTFVAEYLLKLKKDFPEIIINLLLPFKNWDINWSKEQKQKAKFIEQNVTKIVYVSDKDNEDAYNKRNRALVNNASFCVAYFCGTVGGTSYTVEYAKKRGIPVYNIA